MPTPPNRPASEPSPTDDAAQDPHEALDAALARLAVTRPTAPALVADDGETLAWADVARSTDLLRQRLRDLGVGRQDRVVVVLPNGPAAAVLYLGLAAACTVVALPPGAEVECATLLPRLRPAAMVCLEWVRQDAARTAAEAVGVPVLEARRTGAFGVDLVGGAVGASAADAPATPDDIASIVATSGTTGRPKLVPWTHGSLRPTAEESLRNFAVGPADRTLLLPMLGHAYGQTVLLWAVWSGGSILCPSAATPTAVAGHLRRFDPTWLPAAPAFLDALLPLLDPATGPPAPSLRVVVTSAAPTQDALRQRVEAALGARVLNVVGSTEANLTTESVDRPHRPGTDGPMATHLRIVGDDGATVPEGVAGEIQASGDTVIDGYWEDPDLDAVAFTADGWFRTGDRGVVRDGYLTLLGRVDDVVNVSGHKIDPLEVDHALLAHPAVADAAAYPVADPRTGQRLEAAVVWRTGAAVGERDLRRHLLERLSPHKVPVVIRIVDTLPRTASGKVLRRDLGV